MGAGHEVRCEVRGPGPTSQFQVKVMGYGVVAPCHPPSLSTVIYVIIHPTVTSSLSTDKQHGTCSLGMIEHKNYCRPPDIMVAHGWSIYRSHDHWSSSSAGGGSAGQGTNPSLGEGKPTSIVDHEGLLKA